MYKKFSILLISVFFIGQAQVKLFPKDSLLADFDQLTTKIEQNHINIYANISKQAYGQKKQETRNKINKKMSALAFYKITQPFVVLLKDGHTSIWIPVNEYHKLNPPVIPFLVKVNTNDSTLTVKKNLVKFKDSLPAGSIILRINSIPYKEVVANMLRYVSGERYFFRLSFLNLTFVHFLYLLYPSDRYTFEYIYKGEKYTKTIRTVPYMDYVKNYKAQQQTQQQKEQNFQFKILSTKRQIGLLDFNRFNGRKKFDKFLDSIFGVLKTKKIKNLIIDLRNNRGGNNMLGYDLFQYISPVSFKFNDKILIREGNNIKIIDHIELVKLKKNPLRYDDNVYLLINHQTFSSASEFSWAFKHYKIGKVIGEESGGMNICFGDTKTIQLEHTKIYAQVSFKEFYSVGADKKDIHGTLPDYEVLSDKALDTAIHLIEINQ